MSGPVTLAIGPEGGFIAEEIDSLRRVGVEAVSLGERVSVLNATAPCVILSREDGEGPSNVPQGKVLRRLRGSG